MWAKEKPQPVVVVLVTGHNIQRDVARRRRCDSEVEGVLLRSAVVGEGSDRLTGEAGGKLVRLRVQLATAEFNSELGRSVSRKEIFDHHQLHQWEISPRLHSLWMAVSLCLQKIRQLMYSHFIFMLNKVIQIGDSEFRWYNGINCSLWSLVVWVTILGRK